MKSLSHIPSYDEALQRVFTGLYRRASTNTNEFVPFLLLQALPPQHDGSDTSSLADDILRSLKELSTDLTSYSLHCLPDILVVQSNCYRQISPILQHQDECLDLYS